MRADAATAHHALAVVQRAPQEWPSSRPQQEPKRDQDRTGSIAHGVADPMAEVGNRNGGPKDRMWVIAELPPNCDTEGEVEPA